MLSLNLKHKIADLIFIYQKFLVESRSGKEQQNVLVSKNEKESLDKLKKLK